MSFPQLVLVERLLMETYVEKGVIINLRGHSCCDTLVVAGSLLRLIKEALSHDSPPALRIRITSLQHGPFLSAIKRSIVSGQSQYLKLSAFASRRYSRIHAIREQVCYSIKRSKVYVPNCVINIPWEQAIYHKITGEVMDA